MKKIYVSFLFLVLLCSNLFAQSSVTVQPTEMGSRFPFYRQVDSSATATVTNWNFYFSSNKDKNPHSGYQTLVAWADSALTGSVGDRDSLFIDAFALKYDKITGAYEQCSNCSSDDSTNVASWIDWGTLHSDSKFLLSKVLNFGVYDGIRLAVTSKAPVALRFELPIAEERR